MERVNRLLFLKPDNSWIFRTSRRATPEASKSPVILKLTAGRIRVISGKEPTKERIACCFLLIQQFCLKGKLMLVLLVPRG